MPNNPKQQAALARAVLTSATDFAIITTDLAGLITSWNPGAEKLLGWSEDELCGEHACIFFTPEDRAADRCELEMVLARDQGRCEDERWHMKKNGSRLWASGLMMRFEDDETGEHIGYLKILRDRTSQHEANEVMRESERQYRALTQALPGFVFATDTAGRNIFSNENYQDYTGRDLAGLAGENWADTVHPDDRDSIVQMWRAAVESEGNFAESIRFRRHDGAYRAFRCRAIPERNDAGEITRWIGTCVDVEDQQQAESDLAYEKGLLDAVVSQAPIGISIAPASPERQPVINEKLRATLGHGAKGEGLERYSNYGAIREDGSAYEPRDYPTVRALTTGERVDRELMRYRVGEEGDHPAGSLRRLEVSSGPVLDGGDAIVAAVTVIQDIEDALQAADAMRCLEAERERNRAELQLALDAGKLGTFSISVPDQVLTTSRQCRVNYGRNPDLPFTFEEQQACIHPDDREDRMRAIQHSVDTGQEYDIAFRIRWPDETEHWIHSRGQVVRDANGAVIALGGVSANVTAEKMQEVALNRLNLDLEHAVDRRTGELLAKNEELLAQIAVREQAESALRQAQKMEAVGQLTGGVAHDFNNLLTIIKSSVELLSRPNITEERRKRYTDAISETTDRAAKLTAQLLAFARRQPLKAEHFDLGNQLLSSLPILRTTTGSRINIVTSAIAVGAGVEVDRNQFDTAILNMIVNARDAMPEGGEILISTGQSDRIPAVRNHVEAIGDYVTVTIADTGTGMDAGTQARIFEPFYTTKEVGRGTGLGLSQVYGFAKQSGGEVIVRSEAGVGTEFILYLPRAQGASSTVSVAAPHEERVSSPGEGCVLVVEDNQLVGEFATQLLEDVGYGTVWAPNAQVALDRINEQPDRFDVVFTDVVMPGMSGIELAQELRRLHPELPVVLTSGYSQVLAQEGAHGFDLLQKPYSVGKVVDVLNRIKRG